MPEGKGLVHIYTGMGKGKTTAALGLALRAAGAGLKVFIAQFIKKQYSGELQALSRFPDEIIIKQYGKGFLQGGSVTEEDSSLIGLGLRESAAEMATGRYDLVILDEILVAVHRRLVSADEVLEVIRTRPQKVELVLTGRCCEESLLEAADLVTEMREVKHYFRQGIRARRGIEY